MDLDRQVAPDVDGGVREQADAAQALLGCRSTGLQSAEPRPYRILFEGNSSVSNRRLEQMILLDLADFERLLERVLRVFPPPHTAVGDPQSVQQFR